MEFPDNNFLLTSPCARTLYHKYAAGMPIADYHCHINVRDIYENRRFENLTQIWLESDHYKWRLMRACGIEERFITGAANDWEKFQRFSEILPRAIGNPVYQWCHMELKNYFGYTGVLDGASAQEVWRLAQKNLAQSNMSVRGLINKSNVVYIGTTDDPLDSLCWHERLASDDGFKTVVSPTFRPDQILNCDKPGWKAYIKRLSEISEISIHDLDSLESAIAQRMDYFSRRGCKASDHGLDYMFFQPATINTSNAVVKKALAGDFISRREIEVLKTTLLCFCAKEYCQRDWVMQLHFGCLRNPNRIMYQTLGADSGFDCINYESGASALADFLDKLYAEDCLPRTILYSLNAGDNAFIDTLTTSFQKPNFPGWIQHGSAWWFNDNRQNIRDHLISVANQGILGNFIGMLTDSRSFLSYSRHEYFRRILCSLIGEWIERGEYPQNLDMVGNLIQDICLNNVLRYFKLEVK